MQNLSKWVLLLLFAATTTLTFTACNKQKIADDKCAKEFCADQRVTCEDQGARACGSAETAQACESGSEKKCCKKKDAAVSGDSTSGASAHLCDDKCHKNGCSHNG